MNIMAEGDGQNLVYEPPTGANFEPVSVSVPFTILDHSAENAFRLDVRDEVRTRCGLGRSACRGDVSLSSSQGIDPSALAASPHATLELLRTTPRQGRIVQGGLITCSHDGCPLNEPPTNDNELLQPRGPLPSLQAEAEIPSH